MRHHVHIVFFDKQQNIFISNPWILCNGCRSTVGELVRRKLKEVCCDERTSKICCETASK